jgi:hypothetical protein
MNQLDEARTHLSEYEKLKGSIQGLTHLSGGISILSDVLAEDCSQYEKTTATNQGRTYRKDVVDWCHELLSGKAACSAEMDTLDYCSLALKCFSDINPLIGQDERYTLLEKKLSEQTSEQKEAKIMKKDLVDGLLRLSEDERNRAYSLLARLEIYVQGAVEKEEKRRLKTTRDALFQEHQPEGILQKGDLHIYSVHNAKAMMVRKAGAYIILKDSTAIRQEKDSLPDSARRKRRELIASGVLVQDPDRNLLRFTKDVVFDSPSAASCTVSACSTDGWKCFKINH